MAFGRQLADAVTRYAAELDTIAARNRPAASEPGPGRAGSVMARRSRRGGWSWYLRPPLCLSRDWQGRGDQRMRRVVTGEQVAQIYNPDPFARPVFRAPVYRTPAGIILIAWLVRLIARLLRLVFRHPVAAAAVAVLAFMWVSIGWIGVAV